MRALLNTQKLRYYLTKNCIPYKSCAKSIGISASYLSQLMSGKRSPSGALRQKFLEVLKCERFDDLFVIKDIRKSKRSLNNRAMSKTPSQSESKTKGAIK